MKQVKKLITSKRALIVASLTCLSVALVGCKSHIHEAKVDKTLIKKLSDAEVYAHKFALKKKSPYQYYQCIDYPKAGCKEYMTKMAEYLSKNGYPHTTYQDLNNKHFLNKVTVRLGEYDEQHTPFKWGDKII